MLMGLPCRMSIPIEHILQAPVLGGSSSHLQSMVSDEHCFAASAVPVQRLLEASVAEQGMPGRSKGFVMSAIDDDL